MQKTAAVAVVGGFILAWGVGVRARVEAAPGPEHRRFVDRPHLGPHPGGRPVEGGGGDLFERLEGGT